MGSLMMALHFWAGVTVFGLTFFLTRSSLSMDFRYRMGRGDNQRGQNFQLVAFFTFAIGLDMIVAPLGVGDLLHYFAIAFTCLVGTITNAILAWRVWLWKG